MGYSGRIFAVGVKNAVYLCPSTTVPYIEFDREDKEQQCNKPSGECTLVHSSIREGHSMFPSGRSSTAVPGTVVQGVCTIIRDHDTLERTSS